MGHVISVAAFLMACIAQAAPYSPATITDVQGLAQIRQSEEREWEEARPGILLESGAQLRTALGASVTIEANGQSYTLDRLGTVTLRLLMRSSPSRTEMAMRYGRLQYDLANKEDPRIRSPGAVTSCSPLSPRITGSAPAPPLAAQPRLSLLFLLLIFPVTLLLLRRHRLPPRAVPPMRL